MMAFERLEPFNDGLALQFAAGQICAVIANTNRDAKQTPDPWEPEDFMPELRRSRQLVEQGGSLAEPKARGEDLTPDQLSDLLDASLFGFAPEPKAVH